MVRAPGTTVHVRQLFYNTPARKRFLKTAATEQAHLVQRLVEHALSRPDVAWRASHGPRSILALAPARALRERISALHDPAYADTLLDVPRVTEGGIGVEGLVQRPVAATASFDPSAVRNTTSGPSSTKFTGWIAGSAWSV